MTGHTSQILTLVLLRQMITPLQARKFRLQGKVSIQMPSDDWLCRKLSKLNLTSVEGYPSRSSKAGGLLKDQFVQPVKSQAKWYRLHSDQKVDFYCCVILEH